MKHFNELYEKYYNAYKNDYDTNELSEAKKKKFDYKQFELLDKTDKKLILDEETKNKNDKLNNILTVINRIYQFFEYKFCRVKNQMNQINQNGGKSK